MDLQNLPFKETEFELRSQYWSYKLGLEAKDLLLRYFAHCNMDPIMLKSIDNKNMIDKTVKELVCIIVWLSVAEIKTTHKTGAWFKEFTSDAFRKLDKNKPEPSTYVTLKKYPITKNVSEAASELCIDICNQYQLGESSQEALVFLFNSLIDSKYKFVEIFNDSITDKETDIEKALGLS